MSRAQRDERYTDLNWQAKKFRADEPEDEK
jgi:hypothetical protein